MSYITADSLKAYIQEDMRVQGLNDANVEAVDPAVFSAIDEAVRAEIHGFLEGRYSVPFAAGSVPNVVLSANLIFAAEAIWQRRGVEDTRNPFAARAKELRTRLGKIGAGDMPLSLNTSDSSGTGFIESEPNRLHLPDGKVMG